MHQPHRLAAAILSALSSGVVVAQSAPADKPDVPEQIVVIGTRTTDRAVGESVSPIDIIRHYRTDEGAVTRLAVAEFPAPVLVDGTEAVRPAQLYGLAPDQVLVNGKRRHSGAQLILNGSQGRGSAPVDINAIPVAAVERIEVLHDQSGQPLSRDRLTSEEAVSLQPRRMQGRDIGWLARGDARGHAEHGVRGSVDRCRVYRCRASPAQRSTRFAIRHGGSTAG